MIVIVCRPQRIDSAIVVVNSQTSSIVQLAMMTSPNAEMEAMAWSDSCNMNERNPESFWLNKPARDTLGKA